MVCIDWSKEQSLIESNCILTIEEIRYGVRVLKHTHTLYYNSSRIPSTILLLNKKGLVFHIIRTPSSYDVTEKVRLPPLFSSNEMILIATVVATIISVVYYLRRAK